MAKILFGHVFADAPVRANNKLGGNKVPLYHFDVEDPNNPVTFEQIEFVTAFKGKNNTKNKVNFAYEDLEGLAAIGDRVIAVSESDRIEAKGDLGTIVQIDEEAAPSKASLARNLKGVVRFGDEAGAGTLNGKVYNIQGSTDGKIGSSLYLINKAGSKNPSASLIANKATKNQRNGITPVNSEYADALTSTAKLGLIAGDFSTEDGNDNFLYVGVPTKGKNRGLLSKASKLEILDPDGKSGSYNQDAGLASTPDGDIYALLENGTLLELDLNSIPGVAQVTEETTITVLNQLSKQGVDFEGFTIIEEDV